jgi:hypothetical protein
MSDDESVWIETCDYKKCVFLNRVVLDWCVSFLFCMSIIDNGMAQSKFIKAKYDEERY